MRLIESGKYDKPIELKWNECLFVDMWDNYALYTECSSIPFDLRLEKYIDHRRRETNYFNANYIRLIQRGER